jgi:hypothetical protein
MALELVSLETAGDHHLALCDVVAYATLEGAGEPLYTADLPDGPPSSASRGKKGDGGGKTGATKNGAGGAAAGASGGGKGGGAKKKKDPNAPKRPLSSYMIFAMETRGKVLEETPCLSLGEVAKVLGARWKAISPEDKAVCEAKAKEAKARYEEAVKAYKTTSE